MRERDVDLLIHVLAWSVALVALSFCAWSDLRSRVIPNRLVGVVAICGVCLTLAFRQEQMGSGFIIAALALVGLGMLANLGLIGGGDVKLIAASTLLFPPASIGLLLVSITLAGGMLSIIYLAARAMVRSRDRQMVLSTQRLVESGASSPRWLSEECSRIAAGGPMPYAFAILGGVVVTKAAGVYACLHANYCWV